MKLKNRPQHGDKRTIKRFALFPVQLVKEFKEDAWVFDSRIWLEWYYEEQRYFFGIWSGGRWETMKIYQ